MNTPRNVGVAAKIGAYSDAAEVPKNARWLYTAGTPGINADGTLPEDFETQATLAWENVIRILHDADMGVEDIVKVTHTLIRRSDLEAYRSIRSKFLGDARPAFMLSFVNELVWPKILMSWRSLLQNLNPEDLR
jgi:2-iminobutanoate/2-iminopropanoate deaminase